MIKTFETNFGSTAPAGGSTGGTTTTGNGGNTIVKALLVVGALYLGYKFIVKPMLDKKKAEEANDGLE
jgi:hypothetical protein